MAASTPTAVVPPAMPPPHLRELAAFFLKLGTVAFGGPAAHVAMMEDELVRRRRWVTPDAFLDMFAVSNLLPGPGSTELAIFIGYRLCGVRGLLAAGACFILPAFLMVSALAWAYVRFGALPAAAGLLYGVKPVVIAIVVQALWRLRASAITSTFLALLGTGAAAANIAGASPIQVLTGTAIIAMMAYAMRYRRSGAAVAPMMLKATTAVSVAAPAVATTVSPAGVFLVFLKIGSVVFGSGYVILAFLRPELVTSRHWLTEPQLLDAVAVGQVTPGPVFTTATFIGYLLAGPRGAVAATAGIFAPAFALVAIAGPLVHRLRLSALAGALMDALNGASLALMAVVAWQLARAALVDWPTLAILALSAALLLRYKVNATWLVAGGAAVGLAVARMGWIGVRATQ